MTPEKANEMNEKAAKENGGALAFPLSIQGEIHEGLTKREYIATQLMSSYYRDAPELAASRAVEAADYLLIELHKNRK